MDKPPPRHVSPAKRNLNNTQILQQNSGANSQIPIYIPPPPSPPPSPLAIYKGPFGEWCRFTTESEKVGLYNRMSPGLQQYLRPILEDSVTVFNKAFVETRDFARQIELANRYNREKDIIDQLRGKNDSSATRENEALRKQVAEIKGKAEELTASYNTLFMKYQKECLSNKKLDYELTTVKVEHDKKVEGLNHIIEELRNEQKLLKGTQCKKMSPQKVKKVQKNSGKSIFDESIDEYDDNFMEVVEVATDSALKNDKLESLMKESAVSDVVQVENEVKVSTNPKTKNNVKKVPAKSKEIPRNTGKNKKITSDDEEDGLVVSQEKLSIPSCSGVENAESQSPNTKIINKSHEGGSFDGIFSPPQTHHKSIVLVLTDTDDEQSVDSSIKIKNKAGQSSLPKSNYNSLQHHSTLALSESETDNELELNKSELSLNISTSTPTSTTTKPTKNNDIFLSRNARREQILNESPILIQRKAEDIQYISNRIVFKSTSASASSSTSTKASKMPLTLAEGKKGRIFQTDPDDGLYENKSKKIRVSHNTDSTKVKDDVVSQEKISITIPSCGGENVESQNTKIIDKSHEEGSFDRIFSPPRTSHHKNIVLTDTDDEQSVDSSIKSKNKNKAGQSSLPKSKNSVQYHSTLALNISESETDNEHELSKSELSLNISTPTSTTTKPTTNTDTKNNDIFLSRKARREQILNESPILIKRKAEDIRSISNRIVIKSTSTNASSSTSTKASNSKKPLSLAEGNKGQPGKGDKQEILSGIKRIQTRAQKVQVQTKKNKTEDHQVNDSIGQVVDQESRTFQADPDAGLYENKSKKMRISHHKDSTIDKDKKEKKVESTLISVVPSISSFKTPEAAAELGYGNGEVNADGPEPDDEVENNIEDKDLSEIDIEIVQDNQDSIMSDQDTSNVSLEEPIKINENVVLQQPKPTSRLVSSDKNKNEDLELEQGELSDNTIESPSEPIDHKDNLNISNNETSAAKKWTVIGRSGVGQMSKRSQFIIDKFMELSFDEIKNSDEILNMIKKNGDLPSKVNLATWINDYIISNGQEKLAEVREDGPPLSITYGKIYQMIEVLREKMSDLYDELPSLLIEHFSTQLVPMSRNWNDDNLVNYGRLYGAICRRYFETDIDRGLNLLFQILYWSPPHAFAFAYGFLCSCPEILAHYTFDNLSLRGKAISFALIKPPRFFAAKYYPNIFSFAKSFDFILPDVAFDQMVVIVLDALKQTEHDTAIREAGRTLAMLFMQCDWECFLKFIHENLADVVKSWSANQLTDAVLSAFIRMIGDVFHDSIEFKDVDKIQQAIKALTKLDAELRTPILVEAIDTTILKIQAKKRLMDKEGSKEMSWEFKKIANKGKKKAIKTLGFKLKRPSSNKRRRQKRAREREEKERAEFGIRKRKKEMLKAAKEFLSQEKVKVKNSRKDVKPSTSKSSIDQSAGQASKTKNAVKDQNNKATVAVEEKLTSVPVPVHNDLLKTRGKTRASSNFQEDSKDISKVKLPDNSRNRLLKKVSKDLPISHPVRQHYRNKKANMAKK